MTDSANYRREDADGIITVTFTRDGKLNAVADDMMGAIRQAVTDLAEHEEHRALVITAEGRYFTAGIDLGEVEPLPESGVAARRQGYRHLHELFDDIERVEKPVILAAQGPCLGIGVEMGSSCDFRFASPRTTIGLPELPMLAVLPAAGGVSRFTRLVGPHWARWVAMAGETADADLARTMGWIHHVFPEETFHADVHAWVQKLVGSSVEALGLAKLAIDVASEADRRNSRHVDLLANSLLMHTRQHRERVESFNRRSAERNG